MRPKRKAIPKSVKIAVLSRQNHHCAECKVIFIVGEAIEYDHRPALWTREVHESGTDYAPPQNDPSYIDGLHKPCHLKRTVGRLPDAEKTVTTKGSDAWVKAKFQRLERETTKRKAKIPSRPFPSQKRKFQ